jgi:hypothetical protein
MILIDTLDHLETWSRQNIIPPEIYAYIEPTLTFLAQECPERDPETEGGGFTLHQELADLLDPLRGLFITNPGEPMRLPVAEVVEKIDGRGQGTYAVFVALDDESGYTHLVPDQPWLPEPLRQWLEDNLTQRSA